MRIKNIGLVLAAGLALTLALQILLVAYNPFSYTRREFRVSITRMPLLEDKFKGKVAYAALLASPLALGLHQLKIRLYGLEEATIRLYWPNGTTIVKPNTTIRYQSNYPFFLLEAQVMPAHKTRELSATMLAIVEAKQP